MHCCLGYYVFGSDPSGIRPLGSFGLGNASIETVEDLDGDGIPEILAADDRLAYFPDLSFASSPFLPLVLCRSSQGEYDDCTPKFPQFLVKSADDFEKALVIAFNQNQGVEAQRSAALGLLASYIRMGRADEGWMKVQSLCADCYQWLAANLVELENRLGEIIRYGVSAEVRLNLSVVQVDKILSDLAIMNLKFTEIAAKRPRARPASSSQLSTEDLRRSLLGDPNDPFRVTRQELDRLVTEATQLRWQIGELERRMALNSTDVVSAFKDLEQRASSLQQQVDALWTRIGELEQQVAGGN